MLAGLRTRFDAVMIGAGTMRAERYGELGRRLVVVESGPEGRVDLAGLLRSLREEGIRALLCEGGPTLHGALQAPGPGRRAVPDDRAEAERRRRAAHPRGRAARRRAAGAGLAAGGGRRAVRPLQAALTRACAVALPRPGTEERTRSDGLQAQPPGRDPARAHPRLHGRAHLPAGAGDHGGARRRGRARRPLPEDPGRDPRAGQVRGALEPLHARRALRPRADQLGVRAALRGDGAQPGGGADGLQLRRARHRQHGDPRRARHRRAEGALAGAAARGTRSAPASR